MGASHVTLACTDIDSAVGSLRRLGYQPDFLDHDVVNHPSKRSIIQGWSDQHSISLLRAMGGFPIELVSYPVEQSPYCGRYIGVFNAAEIEVAPYHGLEAVCASISANGLPCKAGQFQDLSLPVLISSGGDGSAGLEGLVLLVSDIGCARTFWCDGLGFRCEHETSDAVYLKLASPVAAWRIVLILVRSAMSVAKPPLNARGMSCLSFLSSNVDDDVSRLTSIGAEDGAPAFEITVNRKRMSVAIVAFDGAYIELLRVLP